MRIVLDAMGGDFAPYEIILGAIEFARKTTDDVTIILVGDAPIIDNCLSMHNIADLPIQIVHSTQVVDMNEAPAAVLRQKKDSSISVGLRMLKNGEADAFVSAGNTGAVAVAAKHELGMLKGVDRPAIATLVPGPFGATILVDSGATVNCKPHNLVQFAKMGACYARYMLKRVQPIVGLLSVGEETDKGNAVTKETFGMLKDCSLKFYGNVEGYDIFLGKVDVIVCDGFVGNVSLKVIEGVAKGVNAYLKKITDAKNWKTLLNRILLAPIIGKIVKQYDANKFGGAPLLGVAGTCIIAHGNSCADSISNALERAREIIAIKLNMHILEAISCDETV